MNITINDWQYIKDQLLPYGFLFADDGYTLINEAERLEALQNDSAYATVEFLLQQYKNLTEELKDILPVLQDALQLDYEEQKTLVKELLEELESKYTEAESKAWQELSSQLAKYLQNYQSITFVDEMGSAHLLNENNYSATLSGVIVMDSLTDGE